MCVYYGEVAKYIVIFAKQFQLTMDGRNFFIYALTYERESQRPAVVGVGCPDIENYL